jgi:hypothetical protein
VVSVGDRIPATIDYRDANAFFFFLFIFLGRARTILRIAIAIVRGLALQLRGDPSSVPILPHLPADGDPWLLARQLTDTRRALIPSLMPHGLDPIALARERERRIQARIDRRIMELESLPATLPDHLKKKAMIELKSLKLLNKQRKVIFLFAFVFFFLS